MTIAGVNLFKSYYVVWKLGKKVAQKIGKKSLNRTMQYGNAGPLRTKKERNRV